MQVEAVRQTFVGQLQFELRDVAEKSLVTSNGKIVFLGTFAYWNCKRDVNIIVVAVVVVVIYCHCNV